MKAVLSWSLALGALGSTIPLGEMPAWALPPEEIAKKLSLIPIFLIVNEEGQSISVEQGTGTDKPVFPVFLNQATAEEELTTIRQQEDATERQFELVAYSLGEFYRDKMQPLRGTAQFLLVPADQAYRPTTTMIGEAAQTEPENSLFFEPKAEQVDAPVGTPLFFATIADAEGGNQVPIFIGENSDRMPLFFDSQELQENIDRLKEARPEVADRLGVQVMLLHQAIELMESGADDELGKAFQFIADPTAREFTRRAIEARQQQGEQPQQPQPQGQ